MILHFNGMDLYAMEGGMLCYALILMEQNLKMGTEFKHQNKLFIYNFHTLVGIRD